MRAAVPHEGAGDCAATEPGGTERRRSGSFVIFPSRVGRKVKEEAAGKCEVNADVFLTEAKMNEVSQELSPLASSPRRRRGVAGTRSTGEIFR